MYVHARKMMEPEFLSRIRHGSYDAERWDSSVLSLRQIPVDSCVSLEFGKLPIVSV